MARDYEKYDYAELAFPRKAVWYQLMKAEADVRGTVIARIAMERLAKSYLSNPPQEVEPAIFTRQLPIPAPPAPPVLGKAIEEPVATEATGSEEQRTANVDDFLSGGAFLPE